ncbi:hypothetical protein CPB85DRAFT_191366 [Mucidula mucida]|nr:hypothetical protein CPB85DRAFT_191366 [Mucidula mucida]
MRFSIIVLLASAVSGMSLYPRQSDLPDCAMTCIQSADSSGCSSTDQTCLCKSSAFVQSSATCLQSTCSADELNTAVQVAEALCKSVVCICLS